MVELDFGSGMCNASIALRDEVEEKVPVSRLILGLDS